MKQLLIVLSLVAIALPAVAIEFSAAMQAEALEKFNCGTAEACAAAFSEAFRNGDEDTVRAFRDFGLKWQLYHTDDVAVVKNDSSLAIVAKAKEINACGENVDCILERAKELVSTAQTGKDKDLAKAVEIFEVDQNTKATEALYTSAKKLGRAELLGLCAEGKADVDVCANIVDSATKNEQHREVVTRYVGEEKVKSIMIDSMTRLNQALEAAQNDPASQLRILIEEADVEDAEDVGYVCMRSRIEERFKNACLAAARIFDPVNGEQMMRDAWSQIDVFYNRKDDAFAKIEAIMRESGDSSVILPKLQNLLTSLPPDTPPFVFSELKRMIGEMQRYVKNLPGPIYYVTEDECRNKGGVWNAAGINYKGRNVNCYIAETACIYPAVMPRRCEPGEKPAPPPPRGFPWECPPFDIACIPDFGQPACNASYKDQATCNTQPSCYWTGSNCRSKYCPVSAVPPPNCPAGQNPLGADGCEVCTPSRDIEGGDKVTLVVRYGDALEKKIYSKKEAVGVCKNYPEIYSMNTGICASLLGDQPTPKVCPPLPLAPAGALCSGGRIEKWGKKDYGDGLICPFFEGCEESQVKKTGLIEGVTTELACRDYYTKGAAWFEPDKVCYYYPTNCPMWAAYPLPCPDGTSRKYASSNKPWVCPVEPACTQDVRPPISSPVTDAQVACLRERGVPETAINNFKRAGDGFANFASGEMDVMKAYMPIFDACRTCTGLTPPGACWDAGICRWDYASNSCKTSSSVRAGDTTNVYTFSCPDGWEPKRFGSVNGCIKTGTQPVFIGAESFVCPAGRTLEFSPENGWPTGRCLGTGITSTGGWTEYRWNLTVTSMIPSTVTQAQKDAGKLVVEGCARTANRSLGMSDLNWDSFGVPTGCNTYSTTGGTGTGGSGTGGGCGSVYTSAACTAVPGCAWAGTYCYPSSGTGTMPAGQIMETWNAYGLTSSRRTDADSARVARLKDACKYAPSWAPNVWEAGAGDYSSVNFGMPNEAICKTYTSPPSNYGTAGTCSVNVTQATCSTMSGCMWQTSTNTCTPSGSIGGGSIDCSAYGPSWFSLSYNSITCFSPDRMSYKPFGSPAAASLTCTAYDVGSGGTPVMGCMGPGGTSTGNCAAGYYWNGNMCVGGSTSGSCGSYMSRTACPSLSCNWTGGSIETGPYCMMPAGTGYGGSTSDICGNPSVNSALPGSHSHGTSPKTEDGGAMVCVGSSEMDYAVVSSSGTVLRQGRCTQTGCTDQTSSAGGSGTSCGQFVSQTSCSTASGCYWQDNVCNGTYTGGSYSGSGSNCPAGYHYHADSGAYCMNDQENYSGTCYNSSGTATMTCPSGSSYATSAACPSGQYWYTPPGGGAGYCMSSGSGGSASCSTFTTDATCNTASAASYPPNGCQWNASTNTCSYKSSAYSPRKSLFAQALSSIINAILRIGR